MTVFDDEEDEQRGDDTSETDPFCSSTTPLNLEVVPRSVRELIELTEDGVQYELD